MGGGKRGTRETDKGDLAVIDVDAEVVEPKTRKTLKQIDHALKQIEREDK